MNRTCDDRVSSAPPRREIKLQLGDVLARLPPQFLQPGPHNAQRELRLTVADLAREIARGKVSVPLTQIAESCPEIFRGELGLAEDIHVTLPLQKLLEQIEVQSPAPRVPFWKKPLQRRTHSLPTMNAVLSFPLQPAERLPAPLPAVPIAPKNPETISLDLSAIFRLLPSTVVGHAFVPDPQARVVLPLSLIEPQMAGGHVEISLADFARALPAKIAAVLNLEADEKVWLPLDEILQNLPSPHPFHFGEMEPLAVAATAANHSAPAEESTPSFPPDPVATLPAEEPAAAISVPLEEPSADDLLLAELNQTPGVWAAALIDGARSITTDNFPPAIQPDAFTEPLRALHQAAQKFAGALGWKNQLLLPCADFWLSVFGDEHRLVLACHHAPLATAAEEKLRALLNKL